MPRPTREDLAFVALVDRYLERVHRYLCNLTRDRDEARELAHETFLNLRRRLDPDRPPAEAYVFTAARNAFLSRWRRRHSEERLRERVVAEPGGGAGTWRAQAAEASPQCAAERDALRSDLQAALARLPEDQRSVFLLSAVEGLKYGQIAEVMAIPAGTVASRKHHAVRALREELERRGHALR